MSAVLYSVIASKMNCSMIFRVCTVSCITHLEYRERQAKWPGRPYQIFAASREIDRSSETAGLCNFIATELNIVLSKLFKEHILKQISHHISLCNFWVLVLSCYAFINDITSLVVVIFLFSFDFVFKPIVNQLVLERIFITLIYRCIG